MCRPHNCTWRLVCCWECWATYCLRAVASFWHPHLRDGTLVGGLEYCIMDRSIEYGYEVFWHLDTLPITEAVIRPIRCSNQRTELDCCRVDASKKSACCWVHVIVEAFNSDKRSAWGVVQLVYFEAKSDVNGWGSSGSRAGSGVGEATAYPGTTVKIDEHGYDLNKESNNVFVFRRGLLEGVVWAGDLYSGHYLEAAVGWHSRSGTLSLMRWGRLRQTSITGEGST